MKSTTHSINIINSLNHQVYLLTFQVLSDTSATTTCALLQVQHVQQDFSRSSRCHLGSVQEEGSSETRPHCLCSFLSCFSKENLPHLFLIFYLLQLGQFSTPLIVTCINSFITGKSSWTSIILRKVKAETGSMSQKVLQVTDLFLAAALWTSLCINQKRVVLQLCF